MSSRRTRATARSAGTRWARERVLHESTHGGFRPAAVLPDGRLLACAVHDEVDAVWVWDTPSGSPVGLITHVGSHNQRLASSPTAGSSPRTEAQPSRSDMVAARTIRAPGIPMRMHSNALRSLQITKQTPQLPLNTATTTTPRISPSGCPRCIKIVLRGIHGHARVSRGPRRTAARHALRTHSSVRVLADGIGSQQVEWKSPATSVPSARSL